MLASERLAILVLSSGVFLSVAMVGCGGKTAGNSTTDFDAGLGGNPGSGGSVGLGGSASFGGSSATIVVLPRVPTAHRAQALSCVGVFAPPEPPSTLVASSSGCKKHADCTLGANGRCAASGVGMAGGYYSCNYDQCETDADCDPGKICYCTASGSARCFTVGNCQTDADCGGGSYSYCSPSMGWDCGGYRPIDGYHCHTALDSCLDDADCTGSDYCNFDVYLGRWKCTATDNTCVIG